MKTRIFAAILSGLVLLLAGSMAAQQSNTSQISGDYIETRSADIYTGQCFANGEVGLVGNEAILGWRVQNGAWDGVRLDGLSVVAAVRARATLGDPYGKPYPAKSVLIVDDQATPEQRTALEAFAHHMGGELLAHVERVIAAPVALELGHEAQHHGTALLRAGQFATVETRPLGGKDHICGNEYTFYPPLTQTTHAMPVVAVTDEYQGPGLGTSWESHGKRSAFVGSFATSEAQTMAAVEAGQ
ncbi:MAG TPA: DUF1326 domain-containing protein [Terriglobales bacterium]|nr:DUF1326 domain-containing protein [Terriglobales bacterium]